MSAQPPINSQPITPDLVLRHYKEYQDQLRQNFIETVERNATRLVTHESVLRALSRRCIIDDKKECLIDLECDEPPELDVGDGNIFRPEFLQSLCRFVDQKYYSAELLPRGRQRRVCLGIKRVVPIPVAETDPPKTMKTETPCTSVIPLIGGIVICVLFVSLFFVKYL
jgi:hypothetical protein